MNDEIKAARSALEDARKRLLVQGKQGQGRENEYAEAARQLAKVDPTFRMPKGQK